MIRVMLADDQAMVRGALAALLALETDIEVVAQVGNGNDVLPVALEHRPDVVLMDVDMPGTDGLSATASLLERLPATRVLIVTTFGRPGYLSRALEAGASGFLVKDAPPDQMLEAIRTIHRGDAVIGPSSTKKLVEKLAKEATAMRATDPHILDGLTEREIEVLKLVAQGQTNGEIAKTLTVAEATIKTHIGHIFYKLGARDRVQAVVLAYEAGLVRPGDLT